MRTEAQSTTDDVDSQLAAEGIEITAEGIRIFRVSWMSDEQWISCRDQMQAWWDGYCAALVAERGRKAGAR